MMVEMEANYAISMDPSIGRSLYKKGPPNYYKSIYPLLYPFTTMVK